MDNKIIISLSIEESCIKAKAFDDIFTKVINIGMIMGKPKIAIRLALLLALDAIADINVNVIENPKLAKNIAKKNKLLSRTGLPITKLNMPYAKKLNNNSNKVLYSILEMMMAIGLTSV